jgi:hypothetical protein
MRPFSVWVLYANMHVRMQCKRGRHKTCVDLAQWYNGAGRIGGKFKRRLLGGALGPVSLLPLTLDFPYEPTG